jgi:nucleoside-diphosphate-sugar epimerase
MVASVATPPWQPPVAIHAERARIRPKEGFSVNVVITGGAGFLGRRLARKLLERGTLKGPDGTDHALGRLVLVDIVAAAGFDDPRVQTIAGDIGDLALLRKLIDGDTASVFHLAAVVSAQAEAEFDLGMRVNLDASRALLDACRATGRAPRVVFTSSVAVYGGQLPDIVADDTALNPQSSYGAQKAIGELLLADYTRKGFVDGRVLRLPTISVRPGQPNKAASSFASGIVREPLNGVEHICPVAPHVPVWVLSPRRAIDALVLGHELSSGELGMRRAINVPGISVRVSDMVSALRAVAGDKVAKRVRFAPDPAVQRIIASWPPRWETQRAEQLGFRGDADFESIIRAYIEDELSETPA